MQLQFSHGRAPSRLLELADPGLLTVPMTLNKINALLLNMHSYEWGKIASENPPCFYLLETSGRVVVSLPPLAVVALSGSSDVLWKFLGFLNLDGDNASSPFRDAGRGDYALANFSPFRTRLVVGDISVSTTTTMYMPNVSPGTVDDWKALTIMLSDVARVVLSRVVSGVTVEYSLSSIPSLLPADSETALAGAPPPPSAASEFLQTTLSVARKALGLIDLVVPDGHDVDFKVDSARAPALHISPLYQGFPRGCITATIKAGAEASKKLGFAPAVLGLLEFDAGVGVTDRADVAYARQAPPEWDDVKDGEKAQALLTGALLLTMAARDVSDPNNVVDRTALGRLNEIRAVQYRLVVAANLGPKMPPAAMAAGAGSDIDPADYEMPVSEYQLLTPDAGVRTWGAAMTVATVSKAVIPVVPEAWDIPVSLATFRQQQQQQQQQQRSEAEADVEEAAAGDPTTESAARPVPAETEEQQEEEPKTEEAEFATLEPGEGGLGDVELPPPPPPPPPRPTGERYRCVRLGLPVGSDRRRRRVCPLSGANDQGLYSKLPDTFYATLEQGDRTDWLGPLGLSCYVGTFKATNGERLSAAKPVVLRGGGLLSHLTFRILSTGFEPVASSVNGAAFITCRFHPHRARALSAAYASLHI